MKKFTKGLLIFSLIVFILGVSCLIAGCVMGIRSDDVKLAVEQYVPFVSFEEENIVIDDEVIIIPDIDESDTDSDSLIFDINEVTEMEIDLSAGNLFICTNDKEKIMVDISKNSNVKASLRNGTLDIEKEKDVFGNNNGTVTVYLPEDMYFAVFELQAGAGNVTINGPIQAKNIAMELGASALSMTGKMTADAFSLEIGAGTASFDYLDAKKIELENGAGRTVLGLAGQKEQYNVTIDSAVGTVKFGDDRFAGLTDEYRNQPKDAERFIQIESALGEIDITFKKEIEYE